LSWLGRDLAKCCVCAPRCIRGPSPPATAAWRSPVAAASARIRAT
jgi:hypothetical protein